MDTAFGGGRVGPSAYEVYVAAQTEAGGEVLSRSAWVASLKGDKAWVFDPDYPEYVEDHVFPIDAAVRHEGSLYVALRAVSNVEPGTDDTAWLLIVEGVDPDLIDTLNEVYANAAGMVERYGAVGDGVTDDTAAIQAAFDAIGAGGTVYLADGKTYLVTNLTLKNIDPGAGNLAKTQSVICHGEATIKRRSGGDTTYMIASERWVDNVAYGSSPWCFEGIQFDGAGLCDYVIASTMYQHRVTRCRIKGGSVAGFLQTRQTPNGTTAASYMSNNIWRDCHFYTESGTGLLTQGTAADNTDAPTDGSILNCSFGTYGGDYSIDLGNAGGWILDGNHTYSSEVADIRIRRLARMGAMTANVCEELVIIDEIGYNGSGAGRIGGGNNFWAGVQVNFRDDTVSETLVISGDMFSTDITDTFGTLRTNTSQPNKKVFAQGCTFRAATPVVQTGTGVAVTLTNCDVGGTIFKTLEYAGNVETSRVVDSAGVVGMHRSSSTSTMAPGITSTRYRGSVTTPEDVQQYDLLLRWFGSGHAGGGARAGAALEAAVVEPTPGATAMGSRWDFRVSPLGTAAVATVATMSWANGLTLGDTSSTVIDADRGVVLRGYTAAELGNAAHAVNTQNKRIGKKVIDTTNDREMRAKGAGATANWVDSNGGNTITPA